ncbi:uncharacterized protein LOC129599413 [Paramacrobiotus metropolitanus]|uniref:uncharacterized protein LOC129599413 n=1 Tax=Paramacrobiotus metropolitanus TaxID=2943436 RepID=UPI00244649B6|nr:uncharacterized protein LOC129599413 [Paramacrobiotus metropolitanus]
MDGYQRLSGQQRDQRLPITLQIMRHLKDEISKSSLPSLDKKMYWAAFTAAFTGLLRVSEYTAAAPNQFAAKQTLLLEDVTLHTDSVVLNLKSTKTDQFGYGYRLSLRKTGRSVYPVESLRAYTAVRTTMASQREPLFIQSSGAYLTRSAVDFTLKKLLRALPDHQKYSTHSFRIGGTTTAALAGCEDSQIQRTGRWKSGCFAKYIRGTVPVDGINPYR